MDHSALIERLRKRCARDTRAKVASDFGVSQQYLSDVLRGHRPPGPAILDGMGVKRRVVYEPGTDE